MSKPKLKQEKYTVVGEYIDGETIVDHVKAGSIKGAVDTVREQREGVTILAVFDGFQEDLRCVYDWDRDQDNDQDLSATHAKAKDADECECKDSMPVVQDGSADAYCAICGKHWVDSEITDTYEPPEAERGR